MLQELDLAPTQVFEMIELILVSANERLLGHPGQGLGANHKGDFGHETGKQVGAGFDVSPPEAEWINTDADAGNVVFAP